MNPHLIPISINILDKYTFNNNLYYRVYFYKEVGSFTVNTTINTNKVFELLNITTIDEIKDNKYTNHVFIDKSFQNIIINYDEFNGSLLKSYKDNSINYLKSTVVNTKYTINHLDKVYTFTLSDYETLLTIAPYDGLLLVKLSNFIKNISYSELSDIRTLLSITIQIYCERITNTINKVNTLNDKSLIENLVKQF